MLGERLLEREGERGALAAALASAAEGHGRLVVLEGEAGQGKTALIDLAAELAAQRAARVVAAHGGVLEADVAWGVVRQLFEPLVLGPARIEGLLDRSARAAAPVFGLAGAAAGSPLEAGTTPAALHALLRMVARLAEDGPVLVSVDDAHWADEASLRWLVYLGRRVERLGAVVAVAHRLGEPSDHDALLGELTGVRGATVLSPPALSEGAAEVLAAEAFGSAPDGAFVEACVGATGGNAFLLVELLRALSADGAAPSEQTGREVRALRPPTVVADVRRRLARLSPEAVELAYALAVLDGEAELRHVVELAGLPAAAGEAAADELTLARLLAPGRPVRFAHAILRAAVEAELPPARRAAAHRRAAAVLDSEPALADRAASHLLACEPAGDAWVAERLRAGAERAMARGAPEPAVRLLERALREPDDRWEVRLALGRAHRLAGRLEPAAAELELALDASPPGRVRAEIAGELAGALSLSSRGEESVAVLDRESAALAPGSPERRRLESAALALRMLVDALAADTAARIEREVARADGGERPDGVLLGALALTRARTGAAGAHGAAQAAERALSGGRLLREQTPDTVMVVFVVLVLALADRDAEAEHWLEQVARDAAGRGAELTLSLAEMGFARLRLFRGELATAAALARQGVERALLGSSYGLLTTMGTLTEVLVERGSLDEADRLLDDLELDGAQLPAVGGATTLLRARMQLRSAQGRHADAAGDADGLLARLERRGHRAPGPLGEAALVLLAAGHAERARSLAAEELERARRWGTVSAVGIARRILGEATGGAPGRGLLDEAVCDLSQTPCRLELAKALLGLGAGLRRANQRAEARARLRRALDLATRCGADTLVDRADAELRACGARPRRALLSGPDALTASERRVAELAASGLSNPEVARALVVSRATVESHLRAAYRKLDIASREQLAAALGDRAP